MKLKVGRRAIVDLDTGKRSAFIVVHLSSGGKAINFPMPQIDRLGVVGDERRPGVSGRKRSGKKSDRGK